MSESGIEKKVERNDFEAIYQWFKRRDFIWECMTQIVEFILGTVENWDVGNDHLYVEVRNSLTPHLNDEAPYSELEKIISSEQFTTQTDLEDLKEIHTDCDGDLDEEGYKEELQEIIVANQENREIYEWWAVDDRMAAHLEDHGQCVARIGMNAFWGREATGQAWSMDPVMFNIIESVQNKALD